MSNVTPMKRKGSGEPPREAAHIDSASYALLMIVFNDLTAYRDSEPDRERAALMRKTATKLNAVLGRFEPPKGAA